jgi:hypothetical protein
VVPLIAEPITTFPGRVDFPLNMKTLTILPDNMQPINKIIYLVSGFNPKRKKPKCPLFRQLGFVFNHSPMFMDQTGGLQSPFSA